MKHARHTEAANAGEPFDVFDEEGVRTGTEVRARVHTDGLWHRSSQVFVLNADGQLLLQKRSASKDLYAGLWDYSVGEHLQPGESHVDAAIRGLYEELGIRDAGITAIGQERWVEWTGTDFVDREIQQAYTCVHVGDVSPDPGEVQICWFVDLSLLERWISSAPQDFTPWFIQDLDYFGWLAG